MTDEYISEYKTTILQVYFSHLSALIMNRANLDFSESVPAIPFSTTLFDYVKYFRHHVFEVQAVSINTDRNPLAFCQICS